MVYGLFRVAVRMANFHLSFFQFSLALASMLLLSCSTVRRLPEGELLYTGTRKVEVVDAPYSPLRDKAVGEARVAFVSPPNNALFGSSRYRTPLPLGLWAYNAFLGDSTGLRRWLFRTFAAQPILISTVNPTFRAGVAANTLRNYGYFDGGVSYRVDTLAGNRRAQLSYVLRLGSPWYYGMVEYRGFISSMDSLMRLTWGERLLREGEQFAYTTLSGERNRLFTLFREHGYYFFRPEMVTILADTMSVKGRVPLRIELQQGVPRYAMRPWYVGHTYLSVRREVAQPLLDTLETDDYTYIYGGRRTPIRRALLDSRLAYRRSDAF